jgi:hypothetical protein
MRFLDYDKYTGITEHFGQLDGKNVVKRTQNVDGIVDETRSKLSAESSGWKGEFHHVASIPLIVIDQWREELKAKGVSNPDPLARDNKSYFIAKINSSDFSAFRTKSGRV